MPAAEAAATRDGLARQHWPGSGDVHLLFAHATGFCKEVWSPVVEELRARDIPLPAVAWDFPGHGDSEGRPPPYDWWELAGDTLAIVDDAAGEGTPVGVGHSMGGAALVMAELSRPGTFAGLVLVEPIIMPPPFVRAEDGYLSQLALRRRASFADPEQAHDNFASKMPFAAWDRRALDAYVAGGLAPRRGRWWLKCAPKQEAEVYRNATAHGAYARLGEIAPPVRVVAGEHSDSHPREYVKELTSCFPQGEAAILPGTSHFAPMERPDLVAAEIAALLIDAGLVPPAPAAE